MAPASARCWPLTRRPRRRACRSSPAPSAAIRRGYLESLKRIHDGVLGDLVTGRVYWNQGDIWVHPRKEGWSDTEYQIRNWYHFLWLCGDHIVEQHVHNLDVAIWALGAHPVSAVGMGGRQVHTEPAYGQSYDHFAVDYEFPNGKSTS